MQLNAVQHYRVAGKIAKQVVTYSKKFIQQGMLLIDIAEKIESKIKELGGKSAFPVNLSLNEIAAHYTPSSDDKTIAKGLLKIDLGVSVNGYIADTAFSLDLSEDSEFKEMIELNEIALENVLKNLKISSRVMDVGEAIQETIKESKYSVIRNLSGHSLDKDMIHAGLTISNYKNDNQTELKNMAFAIEPFLTTGLGEVYEGKESEIFRLEKDGNVRDKDAREILKFIKENYSTLPFCKRWLVKQGFKKINFCLKEMVKQGILHNFPVLVEKSKKPVSQAEHTILISDKVEVTTR